MSVHFSDARDDAWTIGLFVFGLLAAFCLLCPKIASAEILDVRVVDSETKKPIRDANVYTLDPPRLEYSDKKGWAAFDALTVGADRLDGTPGYRVRVTHVGYEASDTLFVALGERPTLFLNPKSWVINEIVVTGTRSPHMLKDVPVQTELITAKDFSRTGATSVDEALAWSVGVSVQSDLSGQGATLRGIDGDRVLVLIDGQRTVGRVRGSIDLEQLDLGNVERIEIVKGSGSTLYGSEAMGGVINVLTRDPNVAAPLLNVSTSLGTEKTSTSSLGLQFGRGNSSFDVGGKFYRTDGFDLDPSTPHTNGEEQIARWNFHGKWAEKLSSRWTLTSSFRLMNEKLDWLESEEVDDLTFTYDDDETNRRYEGSTQIQYRSGDEYQMNLRLFGTLYNHRWRKRGHTSNIEFDRSETDDSLYEISYDSNYVIGHSHVATYGFDYREEDLESSELTDTSKGTTSYDGYFQYEYSPIASLNFLPGIRFEHNSAFGDHVNPSLNMMFSPSHRFKTRAFVGRGYRAPSIKQQYFVFDHVAAGYVVYGGSAPLPEEVRIATTPLSEENSINSSLSFEFSYGTIGRHRLTYFYNHLEDLIDFQFIGFTEEYWRGVYVYQNIDRAVTRGLEWESRIRVLDRFDLNLSYDYLSSLNLASGEELINRPRHTGKLVVSGESDTGVGGSIWGEYQSRKLWVSLSNTGEQEAAASYAPDRGTLNASLYKRIDSGWEFFARANNILDKTDIKFGYWPGFEWSAGLKYQIELAGE